MTNKVSLQINLAPGDYPHVKHMLTHQLMVLSKQVDEIILTIDTQPSKGRFANGWETYKELLNQFLDNEIKTNYPVKIIPVDYSASIKQKVAAYFFGGNYIPDKDFRGGPFYSYFFGLFTAKNDLVFHLDSDIFLGGGSKTWVNEAITLFNNDKACFIASPLPGPPHHNDILIDQNVIAKVSPYTWQLKGMSTRLFLIDKSRFKDNRLMLLKPAIRSQVKAIIQGNANADLPEHLLSAYMDQYNLKRIDFLGLASGLWSLHPPYRTQAFYEQLPALITKIKNNNLPEDQQGFYDIIDEVCDWTIAREKLKSNRWWKRK